MKNLNTNSRSVRVLALALAILPACAGAPARAASAGASDAAVSAGQSKLIVEKLAGIIFVKDPKAIVSAGVTGPAGITVRDIPLLEQDEFRQKMSGYLGHPLTEAVRMKIIEDVVLSFRAEDRPILDVSTPPQEITSGVLQILVMEGSVGQVRVEGGYWFDARSTEKQIRLKPGDALDSSVIMGDLDWLNRNPFRQIDLVYAKGSELGKTDLVFREADQFPLRFYAGYEDSGTELTQQNRWLTGANWGNVLGGEGQFNYQFMASPSTKYFRAHSASFVQPLPWRHILTLEGSYSDNAADVPDPFRLGGYSWQADLRYEVPLRGTSNYKHSLLGGFDFKESNSDLSFGGTKVFGAKVDVAEWNLGYNASLKDPWGSTSLRATVFYSHGGLNDRNTKAVYADARAGADPRYVYGNAELNRTTGLPWDFMLVSQATYQTSDTNLVASEQLGFGGYDSIRGYDTRVLNSDIGLIFSNELRTPPMSLLGSKAGDKFQLLAFADYGLAKNKRPLPGERSSRELLGVGPGLRYTISTHLSVRADYGWQLHNVEADRRAASRWHLGAVLSY